MSCKRWIVVSCWLAAASFVVGCNDDTNTGDDAGDAGGADIDSGHEPDVDASSEVDAGVDADVPDQGKDAGNKDQDKDSGTVDLPETDAGTDSGSGEPEPQGDLEITGRWHGNFGGTEVIDSQHFDAAALVEYDNEANVLYTQNPPDATYSPNAFNKIVWTELVNGSFYYCTVDYGLATLADAEASTKTADDSDPENSGCGEYQGSTFPWSKLIPVVEIEGRWHSSRGGIVEIDSDLFTVDGDGSRIVDYDNTAKALILQSPPNDPSTPNQFAKVVWTKLESDSFYYCIVDSGLDSASAARATTLMADASAPETGGCGDVATPWTKLSPPIAVEGAWTDGVTPFSIDSDAWGEMSVVSYTSSSAITQNPADDPSNPSKFNEVVWTGFKAADEVYFCFVSTNEATATDATTNAGTATPSDLDTGCLGAAWTKADAVE